MKSILLSFVIFMFAGCSSQKYTKTVPNVDLNKFLKKWYVIAGRFTSMESGAHNAIEIYSFNQDENRIDIDFSFHKDSFDGPVKRIPQKAWIINQKTNAHWEVSPFWPLRFDYLVIALADDYSWTAIGVPNQKYLWIMADRWNLSNAEVDVIINEVQSLGYPINDIVRVPQAW